MHDGRDASGLLSGPSDKSFVYSQPTSDANGSRPFRGCAVPGFQLFV